MTIAMFIKHRNYKPDAILFCSCGKRATVVKAGYPACNRCAGIKSNTPKTAGIKYKIHGKHALD